MVQSENIEDGWEADTDPPSSMMSQAVIGMALLTPDGRLADVNPALCRLLMRDEAVLRQVRLSDVTHPDDWANSADVVEQVLMGRQEGFQCEQRYRGLDGRLVWGHTSISGLREGDCRRVLLQIVDISASKRQELELKEQRDQFRLLAENATDVVCRLDGDGCIAWLSPSVERYLGRQPQELIGTPLDSITHPDDLAKVQVLFSEHDHPTPLAAELRLQDAAGGPRWMSLMARQTRAENGSRCGWICRWRDIQTEVEIRRELERAIHTDPLTGLPTRPDIVARIAASLNRADHSDVSRAVLSVGVDRLSQVNHALTHRAGDQLLTTVAARLCRMVEAPDLIARGTGDTFIVFLSAVSTAEEAYRIAEQLRQVSKGPLSYQGHVIEPSVSIGLALARSGQSADELLRDATLAMRQASTRGRDRCEFADPELARLALHGLALREELRQALGNGQIQTWFMPIVDLSGGALQGFEALVRWVRPDGTLVMPDSFLPVARGNDLAANIDRLVLQQSIATLAELPETLGVAVNLHASTLPHPDLVQQVERWLRQGEVLPSRLSLEITETALLTLGPEVRRTIERLATLGVRWVVDDFGTGFSSISHLRDLPIHGLKLDRSFTMAIRGGDHKSLRLAQALAGLAEGLGLESVAEGIESAEEAACLHDLGWLGGQGWHFGKAAPLAHWAESVALSQAITPRPLSSRSHWALAVSDHVPVGLYALRVRPDGTPEFLFMSRRWLEMLHLTRDQVVNTPAMVLTRIHPDDAPSLAARWQQSAATRENVLWEGRLVSEGHTTWVRVEAIPLPQTDGTCVWQGVMSDITEGKRQELYLRRLLNEAPIPIAIQELTGDDPKIVFLNRRFVDCLGYDLAAIPRLSDWARRAYPNPRRREQAFELWNRGLANAQARQGKVESIEVRVRAADGSLRDSVVSAVVLGDELVISLMDISPWRQAERGLAEARTAMAETALKITEAIPVGTYTMVQPPGGGMGTFAFMSERFLQICGLDREEAAADPFQAFACVHPDDHAAWVQRNAETFEHRLPFYGECRVVVDGDVRWVSAESIPRHQPDGSTVWEGVLIDITRRKQIEEALQVANQRLHELAITDSLTGISNRRHLEEMIHQAISRAERYAEPLSLILCDIDKFKCINDRFGHDVGDRVLIEFCRLIRKHLRDSDIFGRWGGEEFLILLPRSELPAAHRVTEKLRLLIATTPFPHVGTVTASFGVAQHRRHESRSAWFERLDALLYGAKNQGRNRIVADTENLFDCPQPRD